MHAFDEHPKRNWGKRVLALIAGGVGLVASILTWFVADSDSLTFNGFELHGGPVVTNTTINPSVVALTSHWKTRRVVVGRKSTTLNNYGELQWDVFAFNAKDLSQKWTTRLASIRNGQRDIEATILGVSHNTVWVVADGLMGISLSDGEVIGDASTIEALNPPLRGKMPATRRQMYFDNGLMLIAADGVRWRIDNETMRATMDTSTAPIKTSILGVPAPRASDSLNVLPVPLSSGYQEFKSRAFVVGNTWYGMMHPSEIELQRRDPHTQNFSAGIRYRLWSSPLRDTLDRMRNPAKRPLDFAPLAPSPEFLNGGLLTVPDLSGQARVVGIANPTRFIIVSQDRIDSAATQSLTCISLEGRVCWEAPLGMYIATGFSMQSKGAAQDWALIVTGESTPRSGDTLVDDSGDRLPMFARVRVSDGAVLRFRFADVDLRKLDEVLTPYRRRRE